VTPEGLDRLRNDLLMDCSVALREKAQECEKLRLFVASLQERIAVLEERLAAWQHVTSIKSTELGYQPVCSCGWKGSETDRLSNDFAYTNASEEAGRHVLCFGKTSECKSKS
jgi:hypothetical protein